jgi:uncharacterized protein (UPF0333 family)
MNGKAEISVTIAVLLLLIVVTFGGATFYIWYSSYLSEAGARTEKTPTPGTTIASIIDVGNDQNTLYVTIRNNENHGNLVVPITGHVIGPRGEEGTESTLVGDEVTIGPKETGIAIISADDLKIGITYYVVVEIDYQGTAYVLMQLYVPV